MHNIKSKTGLLFGVILITLFGFPIFLGNPNQSSYQEELTLQTIQAQQGSLDNDVAWDYVEHNSRDAFYRSPGWGTTSGAEKTGAVPVGTNVTLKIRTQTNDVETVYLKIYDGPQQKERSYTMTKVNTEGDYDYWEYTIQSPANPADYYYHFQLKDGTDTDFYQDDNQDGGLGEMSGGRDSDNDWGIVFYEPSYETPEWHQNAVGYQIFPDRFYNGDSTNDAIGDGDSGDIMWYAWDVNGNGVQDPLSEYPIYADKRPWSDDTPDTWDFYGGDLKGVEMKADYLGDLGIDFIWFNPFTEGPDNHGYSVDNYTSIDAYFGKIDHREGERVINDAAGSLQAYEDMRLALAEYDIRPFYDAVVNHISAQSVYFQRFENDSVFGVPDPYPDIDGAYELSFSPYRDWFEFSEWPYEYESWWGFDNIPTLMYEGSNGDVEEALITGESSIFTFWQDHGIGGFRLDVPNMYEDGENSFHINRQIRNVVKENDPEDVVIGEIWGRANPWLTGTMHDGVQNMDLREEIITWVRSFGPTEEFTEHLLYDQENYPSAAFYSQWNVLGNHDTRRILTSMGNNKDMVLLGAAIQFSYPGVPVIYYGDEVGLNGTEDPRCRKPYPWDNQDTRMLNYYKKLVQMREDYEVFRVGGMRLLPASSDDVFAIVREDTDTDPNVAISIFNRNVENIGVSLDISDVAGISAGEGLLDIITGETLTVPDSKVLDLTMQNLTAMILVKTIIEVTDTTSSTTDEGGNGIPGYSILFVLGAFIAVSSVLLKRYETMKKLS